MHLRNVLQGAVHEDTDVLLKVRFTIGTCRCTNSRSHFCMTTHACTHVADMTSHEPLCWQDFGCAGEYPLVPWSQSEADASTIVERWLVMEYCSCGSLQVGSVCKQAWLMPSLGWGSNW